jgi:hypothetical protein
VEPALLNATSLVQERKTVDIHVIFIAIMMNALLVKI